MIREVGPRTESVTTLRNHVSAAINWPTEGQTLVRQTARGALWEIMRRHHLLERRADRLARKLVRRSIEVGKLRARVRQAENIEDAAGRLLSQHARATALLESWQDDPAVQLRAGVLLRTLRGEL